MSLLRENKKKSNDKMLPPVGIEPWPLNKEMLNIHQKFTYEYIRQIL